MSNRNYLAGRRWEYKVMKDLRDRGFITMRTAGSHGPVDIIAVNDRRFDNGEDAVLMIQCKRVSKAADARRLLAELIKNPPFHRRRAYTQYLAISVKGNSITKWCLL